MQTFAIFQQNIMHLYLLVCIERTVTKQQGSFLCF